MGGELLVEVGDDDVAGGAPMVDAEGARRDSTRESVDEEDMLIMERNTCPAFGSALSGLISSGNKIP